MKKCDKPNGLTKFCQQNELSRLSEDQCYRQQRNCDSTKPFAWQTYNYHPYGSKVVSTCYPGQFYWDGYGVSGANVDEESKVNRFPGFEMTHGADPQQMPMFPVNLPQIEGWFDADISSSLRPEANFNNPACNGVTEKSCIPYTFQDFSQLCYDPQETRYIIPEDTFNCKFKGAKYYQWGGEDTRHDRQQRYRNGCDYSVKYFSPNLSFSNFGY